MLNKVLFAAAFAITPMLLSEEASAQCASGYGGYRAYSAPVVSYRAPHYGHGSHYRSSYRPSYGYGYSSPRYRSRYGGYGYGGYGYGGYGYGRGTSVGIGRGGISLSFGF
jgi:hypothetical protein